MKKGGWKFGRSKFDTVELSEWVESINVCVKYKKRVLIQFDTTENRTYYGFGVTIRGPCRVIFPLQKIMRNSDSIRTLLFATGECWAFSEFVFYLYSQLHSRTKRNKGRKTKKKIKKRNKIIALKVRSPKILLFYF